MYNWIFLILLFLFTASCSNDLDIPDSELYEIRDLGQLSTIEYTVGKIIRLDDSKLALEDIEWSEWTEIPQYGERKILISCKAKIKAGVDLSLIKESDIKTTGSSIEITLPPATITSFTMDSESIRTEMENISGSRKSFTQAEKNEFLRQGEEAIKEEMNETDILNQASLNAEVFLNDYYKQMGFEKVIVKRTLKKK